MPASKTTQQNLDAWRRLYTAADLVKKLAPWEFMEETDVFGVQFPGSDEIGYISIMGTLGEHFAVTVYMGDDAANRFLSMSTAADGAEGAQAILETPQLMVSFEDREFIEKQDREIINALELKYRGRSSWPLFRSYRPGYYPWLLEQDEIEKLTIALEQAAGVAMRFEDNPSILDMDNDLDFLVRTLIGSNQSQAWEDVIRPLPPPTPLTLKFRIGERELMIFNNLPSKIESVEVAFSLSPMAVGSSGERPMATYILIVVEPESYFVLGMELLQATDGLHSMWEDIPAKLIAIFNKAKMRPAEISVSSLRLHRLLNPILDDLDIELSLEDELPAVEDVMDHMRLYMQNQQ